jgi:hypothetical protein
VCFKVEGNGSFTFAKLPQEGFGVVLADRTSTCPTMQNSFRQSSSRAAVAASVDYDEATVPRNE